MQIIEEIVLDGIKTLDILGPFPIPISLFPGYTVISKESPSQKDASPQKKNVLKGLAKINLFVGQNNSGKSRFLRQAIQQLRSVEVVINKKYFDYFNNLADDFYQNLKKIDAGKAEFYTGMKKSYCKIGDGLDDMVHPAHITFLGENSIQNIEQHKLFDLYAEQVKKDYPDIPSRFSTTQTNTEYKFVYIPTLRGLIHLDGCKQRDLFADSFKDLYAEKVKSLYKLTDCDVFSGLDFNQRIRGQLLGSFNDRDSIQKYQEFLSKYLFNNQPVLLIPNEDDSKGLTIKIGDEKEQEIHDLGDGLQTLIILTYPPFQYRDKKVLYFIEEPELSLHPGLQRQLLEAFKNDDCFENVQFFITTHSNHLLDISMDEKNTSIYVLNKELPTEGGEEKEPQFTIENVKYGDCRMLDVLGVSNSSVFLSNCTIWVEGITDRLYLKKYIELYWKNEEAKGIDLIKFEEDTHYSFIEYSGNNITHWSFVDKDDNTTMNYESISHKIFVILDMDHPEVKKERKELINKNLPNNHAVLPCREFENLLSPDIIKKVLEDYGEENVEALKIEYTDYKAEYLGTYLNRLLGDKRKREGSYAYREDRPSTISKKPTFCEKALKHIDDWEKLSEDAQKLTEEILQFIAKSNPTHPSTKQFIKS